MVRSPWAAYVHTEALIGTSTPLVCTEIPLRSTKRQLETSPIISATRSSFHILSDNVANAHVIFLSLAHLLWSCRALILMAWPVLPGKTIANAF